MNQHSHLNLSRNVRLSVLFYLDFNTYDQIINAEVQLQLGEEMVNGKVIQRTIGPDGQVTGTSDNNPFLNSIIYDVEFPDCQVKEYAANIIAENMLTQVDSDGMSTTLMEAIVDHRRDDEKALQHHDKYVQTKNGRRHLRKTTKGWELLIEWKDKSESWINLADMKESHPVEFSEYARARGIDKEPAFEWWVPHTLKKEASHPISTQEENQKNYTQVWH